MKVALFSPYGVTHTESGVLYLVANYLLKSGAEVVQLRCDGAVPACGRDPLGAGGRPLGSCARCMAEQRALSQWCGAKTRDLSSLIVPDDVMQSAKWIAAVPGEDLGRAEFRGVNLWQVCEREIQRRLPNSTPTRLSAGEGTRTGEGRVVESQRAESLVRDLFTTFVHAAVAAERFITAYSPEISLVAGGDDVVTQAYVSQLRALETDGAAGEVAVFSYDQSSESVVIEARGGDGTEARYSTTLLLGGITAMRSDPRTWAPEVTAVVYEILTFLGFAPDRVV